MNQKLTDRQIETIFGARFKGNNSEEETIRKIESYGAKYDPNCFGGSAEDQLLVCESLAEATPVKERELPEIRKEKSLNNSKEVSSVKRVSGTCKQKVNFELTLSKLQALRHCNYQTPPKKIAALLENIFGPSGKPGHWLYVAQTWSPRPIVLVINYMIKQQNSGRTTIRNSAAYFTYLIKFRKKRKRKLASTNGSY